MELSRRLTGMILVYAIGYHSSLITIDEKIVKALSKKEMTQTALIDAVKADLEVV